MDSVSESLPLSVHATYPQLLISSLFLAGGRERKEGETKVQMGSKLGAATEGIRRLREVKMRVDPAEFLSFALENGQ